MAWNPHWGLANAKMLPVTFKRILNIFNLFKLQLKDGGGGEYWK